MILPQYLCQEAGPWEPLLKKLTDAYDANTSTPPKKTFLFSIKLEFHDSPKNRLSSFINCSENVFLRCYYRDLGAGR